MAVASFIRIMRKCQWLTDVWVQGVWWRTSLIRGDSTSQLTGLEGSAVNVLVPSEVLWSTRGLALYQAGGFSVMADRGVYVLWYTVCTLRLREQLGLKGRHLFILLHYYSCTPVYDLGQNVFKYEYVCYGSAFYGECVRVSVHSRIFIFVLLHICNFSICKCVRHWDSFVGNNTDSIYCWKQ